MNEVTVGEHAAQALPEQTLEAEAAKPVSGVDRGPLSFAQQRLWLLAQIEGGSQAYNLSSAIRLRGSLDAQALRRALDRIIARHETLRTTFPLVDGVPVQRVAAAEESRFELTELDWRVDPDLEARLRELARDEPARPFNLLHGPLIRGHLARVADAEHLLLISMHHSISDGWSKGVLINEFCALYAAFGAGQADPLAPLALQYAGYALWQRRSIEGRKLRRHEDYWRQCLDGAPVLLELPTDFPRPARQSFDGALVQLKFDARLTKQLKELSRRHGATLYMTMLTAWAILLGRLSGQVDVVVGTPVANRGRSELQAMIGLFVNTLALRLDLSGVQSVAECLAQARTQVLSALQYQDLPFEQVVELVRPPRSTAHSPIFQAMFEWQSIPKDELSLPGLLVEEVRAPDSYRASKFDLTLSLYEHDECISGGMEYATALFLPETAARIADCLHVVLEAMVANDQQRIDRLPLLGAKEQQRLLQEFGAGPACVQHETSVHALVERQAAATPDAIAVVFEDAALSYATLNAHANRLAHYLRGLGVGHGDRVAICVERDAGMVVALLAVLKTGAAYVPLDPAYPRDRLDFMLEDAAPKVVLAQQHLLQRLAAGVSRHLWLAMDKLSEQPLWADTSPANHPMQAAGAVGGLPAYILYTSGSTGQPKGVMVKHGAVVNLLQSMRTNLVVEPGDLLLAVTTFGFDIAALEIFLPLICGATVVVLSREASLDGVRLRAELDRGITLMQATPATWRLLLEANWPGTPQLKIVCGGEALDQALAQALTARASCVWNVYGPTETTIWSTLKALGPVSEAPSIGRPLANTQLYVLDAQGMPAPVGVIGELYIGGAGLAHGYLGRARLSAERFVPNPFGDGPGQHLYRTGDLVRWLNNGDIAFVGRNDAQVKLRGYRIELEEIQMRLLQHERVREAVVMVRAQASSEQRLVAYFITESPEDLITAEQLRRHLMASLPEYMVPAAYVRLDAMPRTPNGKLDSRALPAPDEAISTQSGYVPPQGWIETELAAAWEETLGVERVGRHDDFFALGGHSLLAMRMVSRAQQRLKLELKIGQVFDRPVLAELAGVLADASEPLREPLRPQQRSGRLPLSFAQHRLWLLVQMEGVSEAFHIAKGMQLVGKLDRRALRDAFDHLLHRHESLRTGFGFTNDLPEQHIAPAAASHFPWLEHDLREHADPHGALLQLVTVEAQTPFDLQQGVLVRGRLIQLADERHALLVTMHHLIADGWSQGIMFNDVTEAYRAALSGDEPQLAPLPVQYADYALWQQRHLDDCLRQHADYWKAALAGIPELLDLPTDHPRPTLQDYAGGFVPLEIDGQLTAGLRALGLRHHATLYMVLLAAWGALLSRLARQPDVVVGVPMADRSHPEVEQVVGFFVDTVALHLDLGGAPTVADLLHRVRAQVIGAQQHRYLPDEVVNQLRPRRPLNYSPVFQVMFAWQDGPRTDAAHSLQGLALEPLALDQAGVASKLDLTLFLQETGGRIAGGIEYASALFERDTIERYRDYFLGLLAAMLADDRQRIDRLPLVGANERQQLLYGWNATDVIYPDELCVHEWFEAQARRTPDAVALVSGEFGEYVLSYGELNAQANQLARALREHGVRPDTRVAICLERSCETIIAVLAVLKAGGAYVPLDPSYPVERLRHMLEDAAPAVLLSHSDFEGFFVGTDTPIPVIQMTGAVAWNRHSRSNLDRRETGLQPSHLAYVIYTSGSTGRPKGVMTDHHALSGHMRWLVANYRLDARSATLHKAAFSFDTSVGEILLPLLSGARMVIARPHGDRDPNYLLELMREHGVALVEFVPSALQLLLEQIEEDTPLPLLRHVIAGGETVSPALLRQFKRILPRATLYNSYGPTEATIDVTLWDCRPEQDTGFVPLGMPVDNTQLYILDAHGEPVPTGVVGELCIGGRQLARGYMNQPSFTALKFACNPFEPGTRLYRTGDLARRLDDGRIEFRGRGDAQVKLRGFRIELGEIEVRLYEHAAVREAVVLVREDQPGLKRLVAYYSLLSEFADDVGAKQLQEHLATVLPPHMVPAIYLRLESLPRMPNGKLDRRALPVPEADALINAHYEPPQGAIETALAKVWADILQVERVGRTDDFFALGGDSLLVVRAVMRLQQTQGMKIKIDDVFLRPVLAELAKSLEEVQEPSLQTVKLARRKRAQVSLSSPMLMAVSSTGRNIASRDNGVSWYDVETGNVVASQDARNGSES
ncbi:non-ribosomal peptide synthetase [Dyella flagellata]|uniref:Carrier domain-containing protein n=1 Tax=Dyella flagellata TaxID=1867833 RepID=A0ABQ5X8J9_9GAMM|nr:non-ribosomal peptide synthetase [Dyella flagellata]GLQ87905.1 hypothetical protein GCM10007898_14730 [Dyella flagellata]